VKEAVHHMTDRKQTEGDKKGPGIRYSQEPIPTDFIYLGVTLESFHSLQK
jgi:hypothetical protein